MLTHATDRWLVVVVAVILVAALRSWLAIPGIELLFLFPIILAACYSGTKPALLVALISSAFSILPEGIQMSQLGSFLIRLVCFCGVGVMIGEIGRCHRKESEAELSRISRIMTSLTSSLDLDLVLSTIAQQAATGLGMKACSLRLLSEDGKQLILAGTYGLSDIYVGKGPIQVERSPIDQAALQGEVVVVPDATTDAWFQYPQEAKQEGIVSVLCVPLQAEDELLGVIRLYSATLHQFTDREIELVYTLADQAALAIRNARSYVGIHRDYERLTEAAAIRSDSIRRVSHRLRVQLVTISSSLQVLLKGLAGELAPDRREMIEIAARKSKGLADLIDDALILAQIREGTLVGETEQLHLPDVLWKAVGPAQDVASDQGISLQTSIPEDLPSVMGHDESLRELFKHLVDNALRYTPSGGQVEVRAQAEEGLIRVVIQDNGIGIASEDLPQVFQEYYRAENAIKHQPEGTGLGLAVARGIAQLHQAKLYIDSELGKGTTVQLELPTETSR